MLNKLHRGATATWIFEAIGEKGQDTKRSRVDDGGGPITLWARIAPPRTTVRYARPTSQPQGLKAIKDTRPQPTMDTKPTVVSKDAPNEAFKEEKGEDVQTYDDKKASEAKRRSVMVEQRFLPDDLQKIGIAGDGNCVSSACARGLQLAGATEKEKHAAQLRAEVVCHLNKNPDRYKPF